MAGCYNRFFIIWKQLKWKKLFASNKDPAKANNPIYFPTTRNNRFFAQNQDAAFKQMRGIEPLALAWKAK